ncbi:hypothetical protein K466DRAFT_157399 [Polyporus arcularius HHB13444]|uniref:Uncharacterized protein n=1 Tax=Polyporus arcularius HHB13444 TaxID=1314778 RepID=A0A5C3PBD3_9APHY|nr:hypothetical protein K466DRAFT_157399 [Polyporus arcularius HHB13444]
MCIFGNEAMRGRRGRGRSSTFELPDVEVMRPYRARPTAHWTLSLRPSSAFRRGRSNPRCWRITDCVRALERADRVRRTRHAPPRLPNRVFSELLAGVLPELALAMDDHAVARGGERAPYVDGGPWGYAHAAPGGNVGTPYTEAGCVPRIAVVLLLSLFGLGPCSSSGHALPAQARSNRRRRGSMGDSRRTRPAAGESDGTANANK